MAASIGEDIATNAPSYLLEKSAAGVSSPTRPGADLFAYVSRTTPDVRFAFPASATPINAPELTCAYASRFHLFTYPRAPFLCIFSLFLFFIRHFFLHVLPFDYCANDTIPSAHPRGIRRLKIFNETAAIYRSQFKLFNSWRLRSLWT